MFGPRGGTLKALDQGAKVIGTLEPSAALIIGVDCVRGVGLPSNDRSARRG
jgi:hypothetical protein